jgi:hypothetical protein
MPWDRGNSPRGFKIITKVHQLLVSGLVLHLSSTPPILDIRVAGRDGRWTEPAGTGGRAGRDEPKCLGCAGPCQRRGWRLPGPTDVGNRTHSQCMEISLQSFVLYRGRHPKRLCLRFVVVWAMHTHNTVALSTPTHDDITNYGL